MLSLNKFLSHTEDKVLALKKISSLTGYTEKCQQLFKYTLSFVDAQCQYAFDFNLTKTTTYNCVVLPKIVQMSFPQNKLAVFY